MLALPEAERAWLPAASAPFVLSVREHGRLLSADEVENAIAIDLPLSIAEERKAARCLVLAERPRSLLGEGARRRRNPAYDRLREEAESGDSGGGVLRTGDPLLDLVGLVGGAVIRGVDRLRPGRRAAEDLAETEPYIESPVYEPYIYEISTYEVRRAAALTAALVDVAAERAYKVDHRVQEQLTVPVAKGRHRADRGVLEGTGRQAILPDALALLESTPPKPRLTDLLSALAAAEGEEREASSAALLAAPPGPEPAPVEEHPKETVTVVTLLGPAEGVWVDAERIVIPSDALGRSSVVQVTGADGGLLFGLVERTDQAKGEAVIRISRRGQPAPDPDPGLERLLRELKEN